MQWRQKFLQSGKKEDPAKGISFHSSVRRAHPTSLEELDGGDFERVALYFARDVDTQVIFLVGCLERFGDFAVASGVEFDELFVTGEDAIAACLAL